MQRSESITKLAGALVKVQAELEPAPKSAVNPHFGSRYADLADCYRTLVPVLVKHGLALIQACESEAETGVAVVQTTLVHGESGEWISSELRVRPLKFDPQGLASACTYGRRISLGLAGLVTDTDDDGNAASEEPRQERPRAERRETAPPPPEASVTVADWVEAFNHAKSLTAATDTWKACQADWHHYSHAEQQAILAAKDKAKARLTAGAEKKVPA